MLITLRKKTAAQECEGIGRVAIVRTQGSPVAPASKSTCFVVFEWVPVATRLPLLLTMPEHSNFWKPPETLKQGGSRNPRNYPLTGGINLLFAAAVPRHSRELDTRKLAHKASKRTPQKIHDRRIPLSVHAAFLRPLSPRSVCREDHWG